jgi:uncharacterized membrane protein YdbT with pleckstrin-like domain
MWVAAIAALIAVVVFLAIMLPIWTTEVGVTNQRLILKRGLVARNVSELQLRSIEQVNLNQGVFSRLFGFGRLQVHGTGIDDLVLPVLADPIGLQRALQDAMGAAGPAGTRPLPPKRAA